VVLNIEAFRGDVELYNNTITKNFIYIPEIYLYNKSRSTGYGLDQFYLNNTNEYAFTTCDAATGVNKYLFADGYSYETELESTLFPKLERLSIVYISKNIGNQIFYKNTFLRNIATFGGAITINSPNWQVDKLKSYVVI
jgi:hypothetical protein